MIDLINKFGFAVVDNSYVITNENALYNFISKGLTEIKEVHADVFYSESFKKIHTKNKHNMVTIGVKLESKNNLLINTWGNIFVSIFI